MGGLAGGGGAAADKLKECSDLAMQEIGKAVTAEECGLIADVFLHYKNAQRILIESSSSIVPSSNNSSEQEEVTFYLQKISKWKAEVSDKLQVLSRRAAASSLNRTCSNQITLTHAHTAAVPSTKSELKLDLSQKSPSSIKNGQVNRNLTDKAASSKPTQDFDNGYEAKLIEKINKSIVDRSPSIKWDDVAGLEEAKQSLMEMVILPIKRKDLFTGLRKPTKGLLLFGPPGNGKTMLAKAVASESEATFFNVSACDLTSKWVGEGEKLVRTLFKVAIDRQPSVIFMDEIDSIMSTRLANESESSRRLKSEFLIQFDGVTSDPSDSVIIIGATNKPQELDDAVLRRLVERIYVPLPDKNVRKLLLENKLKDEALLTGDEVDRLVSETEGYSGSDLQALCEKAAKMPLRELGVNKLLTVEANQVRLLRYEDFLKVKSVIRPSLSRDKLGELERWNQEFGSNWTLPNILAMEK